MRTRLVVITLIILLLLCNLMQGIILKITLATVEQGEAEVLEIPVNKEFNDKMIMDLRFPAPAIIGIIQRRNHVIIPKGDTQIKTHDILIIFTKADSAQVIKKHFKVI